MNILNSKMNRKHRKINASQGVDFHNVEIWIAERMVKLMKIDTDKLYSVMAERGIFSDKLRKRSHIGLNDWNNMTGSGDVSHILMQKLTLTLGCSSAALLEGGVSDE